MDDHSYTVDVDASCQEVWNLFWYHGSRPKSGPVSIEILHPGDEIGEGLVRHCTFAVPRYLMSGGIGHSWEWLTQVKPPESWHYDAVGKPLWSRAEGHTRLEALDEGRTRVHFKERYHAFNPVLRALLERRVHAFIARQNETLLASALQRGIEQMRRIREQGTS